MKPLFKRSNAGFYGAFLTLAGRAACKLTRGSPRLDQSSAIEHGNIIEQDDDF
jgi:hypothetical protein